MDMDDKLILKILRAVPTDKWVFPEDVPVDGVTGDMLYELHQSGLLHYEWRNLPYDKKHYRRTPAGSDWIRDYNIQLQTAEHQSRIEALERREAKKSSVLLLLSALAAFFAAVSAHPFLIQAGEWILQKLQETTLYLQTLWK